MLHKKLALGLLALAAPGAYADAATPAATKSSANAVDPESIQALNSVGAYGPFVNSRSTYPGK